MKKLQLPETLQALLLLQFLVVCPFRVPGQSVSSAPFGKYKIDLAGNSDTWVSLPFARPPAFLGLVSSVSEDTIVAGGDPRWTPGQWVYAAGTQTNSYCLLIRSGAKEGFYFPIVGNGPDTLTVNLSDDSLSGLVSGDRIAIVPYWTLGTVFPGGDGVNASPTPGDRKSEVLFFEGSGVNLSASRTFYYWNNGWRQVGAGGDLKNDEVILPDGMILVRHNSSTSTRLTVRGLVLLTKWVVRLETGHVAQRDNFVALPRPVNVSLKDSGLIESGAFRASPMPGSRTDELLVYDHSVIGKNKSPSATYFYWNKAWRRVGAGSLDVGTDEVFLPGKGVIIRKGPAPNTAAWVNLPAY
jgi:uncharacterized protein (TIGR02597 family)